jgi:hypothetical protein
MSEHRTDEIVRELRATAPPAPERVRQTVLELAAREGVRQPRRRPRLRRFAVAALACLVVLTAAAALTRSRDDEGGRSSLRAERARENPPEAARDAAKSAPLPPTTRTDAFEALTGGAALPPGRRLQDYRARIRLRVDGADDLSAKAQQAMREARRMGGFVASVDFATESEGGNATLALRVPVTRIQEAVARFSELGTILAQQVAIADLQPQADRLAAAIARLRKHIAELEAKQRRVGLTPGEQFQLDQARQELRTSRQRRAALVRQGTYATVTLELTTESSAQEEEPGAFGAFWDDASKILVTELIWLLYALVVAGPFVLVALLAFVAERARRRRASDALLAHH